jgi:dihydrofolate reductase
MGKVLMEITMSLDGYTTGPEVSAEAPLGRGGERLHEWMFAGKSAAEVERWQTDHFSTIGAVIIGRRMADLGIGPWGEEPVFHAPCFVVTHRPAETIVKKGGTSYIFVTGGTPLFTGVRPELRLVPTQATNSPLATHLSYQVDACAVRA